MSVPSKHGEAVIVPAAGLTINWGPGVGWGGSESLPNVQATIIGASQGDTLVVSNRTRSGFTVQVLNGGVGVSRVVDWIVHGG